MTLPSCPQVFLSLDMYCNWLETSLGCTSCVKSSVAPVTISSDAVEDPQKWHAHDVKWQTGRHSKNGINPRHYGTQQGMCSMHTNHLFFSCSDLNMHFRDDSHGWDIWFSGILASCLICISTVPVAIYSSAALSRHAAAILPEGSALNPWSCVPPLLCQTNSLCVLHRAVAKTVTGIHVNWLNKAWPSPPYTDAALQRFWSESSLPIPLLLLDRASLIRIFSGGPPASHPADVLSDFYP